MNSNPKNYQTRLEAKFRDITNRIVAVGAMAEDDDISAGEMHPHVLELEVAQVELAIMLLTAPATRILLDAGILRMGMFLHSVTKDAGNTAIEAASDMARQDAEIAMRLATVAIDAAKHGSEAKS